MDCTLPEVGLDSLMSAEFQELFQKKFGITLTASEIQEMTIKKLVELQTEKQI